MSAPNYRDYIYNDKPHCLCATPKLYINYSKFTPRSDPGPVGSARTAALSELERLAAPADTSGAEAERASDGKRRILDAAIDAVTDRGLNYGRPEDNFARIARRWEVHLLNRYGRVVKLDAHDVAMMMVDMKVARLENSPAHADSWVDVAGYAACGGAMAPPK